MRSTKRVLPFQNTLGRTKSKTKTLKLDAIILSAPAYSPNSGICHLCLMEKTLILTSNHPMPLNKKGNSWENVATEENSSSPHLSPRYAAAYLMFSFLRTLLFYTFSAIIYNKKFANYKNYYFSHCFFCDWSEWNFLQWHTYYINIAIDTCID